MTLRHFRKKIEFLTQISLRVYFSLIPKLVQLERYVSLELEIRYSSSHRNSLRLTAVTFRLLSKFELEFSHDGKIQEKPNMGHRYCPNMG